MLVKCPKCGNGLSPSASNCPKCRAPANAREYAKQYAPCQSCGTVLERERHRETFTTQYIQDGNTQYRNGVSHKPCTNCGEPKPLAGAADNPLIVWGVIIFVGFIFLSIFVQALR